MKAQGQVSHVPWGVGDSFPSRQSEQSDKEQPQLQEGRQEGRECQEGDNAAGEISPEQPRSRFIVGKLPERYQQGAERSAGPEVGAERAQLSVT